jgi:hypothetical protein
VVSEYSFSQTVGTYTEISGGTVLGTTANDNESFNAIPLGFTFTYDGTAYTTVSIQTNGFIAFGNEVLTSTVPISSPTGTNNIVAAICRDIKSRDNGELMYLLSGTEPNRVFTVQWKNYRRVPTATANDVLNFQIQIKENGNIAWALPPLPPPQPLPLRLVCAEPAMLISTTAPPPPIGPQPQPEQPITIAAPLVLLSSRLMALALPSPLQPPAILRLPLRIPFLPMQPPTSPSTATSPGLQVAASPMVTRFIWARTILPPIS